METIKTVGRYLFISSIIQISINTPPNLLEELQQARRIDDSLANLFLLIEQTVYVGP